VAGAEYERCRARRGKILQDIRHGIRLLRANPGFTLVAVLTLAIGIASNTTVFSWIDNVLLRPIPAVANAVLHPHADVDGGWDRLDPQ